jgi:CTP:molybdopterin cytidylyltransferase MocA
VKLAGLILAAGESRRMGYPKALLSYRGETFLDRLIGLFEPHCAPVIVVLGAQAERIRAGTARAGAAEFVVNPDYTRGQISSLQCGLAAVPADAGAVLLTLVDHPAVSPETVAALAAPAPGGGPLLRIPRYRERRGHPLRIARELIPEFLAVPPEGAARDVVHRHVARTGYLDVDDPGILADIDDAEAYRALLGGTP